MIAVSFGIPIIGAAYSLFHSAQNTLNLREIGNAEPYPHFRKNQKLYQSSKHNYSVNHPIFDQDYNLIGYSN